MAPKNTHQAYRRRVHRQVAAACVAAFLAAGTVITATSGTAHQGATATTAAQTTKTTQSAGDAAQTATPVTTATS